MAYCRVSKNDGTMNLENQRHAIEVYAQKNNLPTPMFYEDECKGDTPVEQREQLPVLLKHLRSGDTVIVAEVFRLHRSSSGLSKLYREIIEDKKANFITLNDKEAILNTSQHESLDLMQQGIKNIVLDVLSMCAELEKRNISTRTKRALAERKARGIKLGRPVVEISQDFVDIYKEQTTHEKRSNALNLSKTTYYDILKEIKEANLSNNNDFKKLLARKPQDLSDSEYKKLLKDFQELL